MIRRAILPTATGDVSGNGSSKSAPPISGQLIALRIKQSTSPAAGTTLTFTDDDGQPLMTLSSYTTTSKWEYPRVLTQGLTGSDLTAIYDKLVVNGCINLVVSGANQGQTCDVIALIRED